MQYASFTDLLSAVTELRDRGEVSTALAIVSAHLHAFSRHAAFVCLIQAELLAESGRPKDGLDVLERGLASGFRYKRTWLDANPHLAPITALPGFVELAARSQRRWDEAAAETRPSLTLLIPPGTTPIPGHPLLVVLHGNNDTAPETAPFWSSAVDSGWLTAVPQSGEAGATPGSLTWNDTERAHREIATHVAAIKRDVHVNDAMIVLAGFSMGGLQAVALVVTGRIAAHGLVPVAAWLPDVREFTTLADDGAASIRPTYVVVGTKDPSYPGAQQLVALVSKHGGRAQLDARPGLGHAYPEDMQSTLARALDFVRA